MSESTSAPASANDVFALFISDLHLQADRPEITEAFLTFLSQHAVHAERLYLLGDIFEYWAGDDDLNSPFPKLIAERLRQVSDAGVKLFWIAGNRDFLVGDTFAKATGATILTDPHVIEHASQRYVLTHGDAMCTDDVAYQTFRSQVRQPEWQAAFLARPIEERKAIIAGLRQKSQQHQKEQMQYSEAIMDVNLDAVMDVFQRTQAHIMIHGHTHRPAVHQYGELTRYVLSDWDMRVGSTQPARGDWLVLTKSGELRRVMPEIFSTTL